MFSCDDVQSEFQKIMRTGIVGRVLAVLHGERAPAPLVIEDCMRLVQNLFGTGSSKKRDLTALKKVHTVEFLSTLFEVR